MGRIIAITNQKGGVGKTTTAIDLSACVAAQGKKVLLADIDPQHNATSGFGITVSEEQATVYDMLTDKEITAKDIMLETSVKGLSLLPGSIELSGAEIELVDTPRR